MQMALSFVEQHPALDSDRIGLWGSSYSGANVSWPLWTAG